VLALAPSTGSWRPTGFLRDLARFAIPAGTAIGLGVVASFLMATNLIEMSPVRAHTVAVTVLVTSGLYLIVVLEGGSRTRGYWVTSLCFGLLALYFVVLSLPGFRGFFEVSSPDPAVILCSIAGAALAMGGLALTDERFIPRVPIPGRPHSPPSAPR